MESQEQWAVLRQSLSTLMGREAFGRVFSLLRSIEESGDAFDSHEFGLMLDYAEAHLAAWEPRLREVSLRQLWPGWPQQALCESAVLLRSLLCHISILTDMALVSDLQERLPQLIGLTLEMGQEPDLWSDFPSWPQITHLRILRARFGSSLLPFVTQEGFFPGLRSLQLSAGYLGFGRTAWEHFGSPALRQLEALDLSYNLLSHGDIRALMEQLAEHRLASLDLSFNPIGAAGVAHVLCQPAAASLRTLHLTSNEIQTMAPSLLHGMQQFAQLEQLRLAHNGLGADDVIRLAPWRHMPRLRSLSLSANRFQDEDAVSLAGWLPQMPTLERLDLSYNQIGYHGVCVLLQAAEEHPRLRLQLSGNPGLIQLTRSQLLAFLMQAREEGSRLI